MRKLKVFQAQIGFYDSVVAVPSQAAALRAWGVRQNLFADGQARAATDEAAVKAALAYPETPLRRAVGSHGAFELEPRGLPRVPDAPKRAGAQKSARPRPPRAVSKPAADRSGLDAAEAALAKLDAERKAEEAMLARRQAKLETEIGAAQEAYVARRKTATAALAAARQAYLAAGGEA
jgi:hypothetical protein